MPVPVAIAVELIAEIIKAWKAAQVLDAAPTPEQLAEIDAHLQAALDKSAALRESKKAEREAALADAPPAADPDTGQT